MGLLEVFYDPLGYYYDSGSTHRGSIGGHSDHVHVAATEPLLRSLADIAHNRFGLAIREYAPYDPVDPVHVPGSYHYRGLAFDASGGRMADFARYVMGQSSSGGKAMQSHQYTLGELWIQAGGASGVARTMAAIAMAESGGRVGAVGGPNSDGSYDRGLWQINDIHTQFDKHRLTTDALYNARAAVAIYRSQGFNAWTVYQTGAYRKYLGTHHRVTVPGGAGGGITRPGGAAPAGGTAGLDAMFASYYGDTAGGGTTENVVFGIPFTPDIPLPSIPNPLDLWDSAKGAVEAPVDFLKFLMWVLNPHHLIQAVCVLFGAPLIVLGVVISNDTARGAATEAGTLVATRGLSKGGSTRSTRLSKGKSKPFANAGVIKKQGREKARKRDYGEVPF